jgi:hypothetical protein
MLTCFVCVFVSALGVFEHVVFAAKASSNGVNGRWMVSLAAWKDKNKPVSLAMAMKKGLAHPAAAGGKWTNGVVLQDADHSANHTLSRGRDTDAA